MSSIPPVPSYGSGQPSYQSDIDRFKKYFPPGKYANAGVLAELASAFYSRGSTEADAVRLAEELVSKKYSTPPEGCSVQ